MARYRIQIEVEADTHLQAYGRAGNICLVAELEQPTFTLPGAHRISLDMLDEHGDPVYVDEHDESCGPEDD